MKNLSRASIVIFLIAAFASAQSEGVLGDWKSSAGSTVRVEQCGARICMRIVEVINTGGETTDSHNPDPTLRSRLLCGLEVGSGFTLSDSSHATGGRLYDPKSGKTYRGNISSDESKLHLRGYVGIPLLGVSENWSRPAGAVRPCMGL
jgi:uncharacterized protein (DUF2147 family)